MESIEKNEKNTSRISDKSSRVYSAIGGMEDVKEALVEAIEWPKKVSEWVDWTFREHCVIYCIIHDDVTISVVIVQTYSWYILLSPRPTPHTIACAWEGYKNSPLPSTRRAFEN